MINIKNFLEIAVPPSKANAAWLEGAEAAVDYLVSNGRADEVILFSNVGQTYINAVLIPLTNLTSEAVEQLEHAYIDPMAQWRSATSPVGASPTACISPIRWMTAVKPWMVESSSSSSGTLQA